MSSHRLSPILAASLAASLVGCAPDEGVDSASDALVVTDRCDISGLGSLAEGDFLAGRARGGDGGATGNWAHVGGDVVIGDANWIMCRINGALLGDFRGLARVNGRNGYNFRVHVQDFGDPLPPEVIPGIPEVRTVSATRWYRPTRWDDGDVVTDERALVTIPSELPVTVGNAGNQWAWLTFERSETHDTVVCRYRGGAHNPNPCTLGDLEGGESYVLERCTGDDGDDIEAGDVVDVTSMTLRVQSGAQFLPSRRAPQTTITADFDVTPVTLSDPDRDFYQIAVMEDGAPPDTEPVYFREGDLVVGNLRVIQLE
jgi:hypothetical protein